MDFQSIITDWKQNAERHDDGNFSFLRSLKNESDRKVDRAAHRLHQEVFAIIDCTRCANCCKTVSPVFTADDIVRIACHLEMDTDAFTAQYLANCKDEQGWEPKSLPCPFLGTGGPKRDRSDIRKMGSIQSAPLFYAEFVIAYSGMIGRPISGFQARKDARRPLPKTTCIGQLSFLKLGHDLC